MKPKMDCIISDDEGRHLIYRHGKAAVLKDLAKIPFPGSDDRFRNVMTQAVKDADDDDVATPIGGDGCNNRHTYIQIPHAPVTAIIHVRNSGMGDGRIFETYVIQANDRYKLEDKLTKHFLSDRRQYGFLTLHEVDSLSRSTDKRWFYKNNDTTVIRQRRGGELDCYDHVVVTKLFERKSNAIRFLTLSDDGGFLSSGEDDLYRQLDDAKSSICKAHAHDTIDDARICLKDNPNRLSSATKSHAVHTVAFHRRDNDLLAIFSINNTCVVVHADDEYELVRKFEEALFSDKGSTQPDITIRHGHELVTELQGMIHGVYNNRPWQILHDEEKVRENEHLAYIVSNRII